MLFRIWEHSQKALVDLDGKVVDGVSLKVSEASRDPEKGPVEPRNFYPIPFFEKSTEREDKRELVSYGDDLL